jgi:poly-gamma-glutamate capsule biosynthesis protein CapA/YwtB (metallophosphatase superfamily)
MLLLLVFVTIKLYSQASVLFLGDTHFGDNYQSDPKFNDGVNVIKKFGYDYFFENVKDILSASDFAIANLETPLIINAELPVSNLKPYLHWSDPSQTVFYLDKYNIQYVSLGNNHVFDYGVKGLRETIRNLELADIKFFGAGLDSVSATAPLIQNVKGYKLIVFGEFEYRPNYDTLYGFFASSGKPGVNKLDTAGLSTSIKEFRIKFPEAVIVVYPHWGSNYKQAGIQQKENARHLIEAGADIIVGHGAHTVQEIERYKGKWILYNLGNFIFNAPGRYRSKNAKPYGMMAELILGKNSIKLYPLYTNNMETDYQVRLLEEEELADFVSIVIKDQNCIIDNEKHTITLN